jgi:O-antigen/teichoic acid export membrane protein
MVKIPVLGEIVSKLTYLLGVILFSSSNKLELDTFVYIISVSGALYSVILLFGILNLFTFKVANIEINSTNKNLKNSYKYYLNSLLILFYGRVDVIILSKITSSKELGVYTLGYRVTEIISEIGFNAITYYFRELIEKGRNFLAQSIKIVLNIIYFLISLGLIFGFNIAKYLNYDQAKFTKILSIFALAGIFMLLNQLSQFILITESKPYYISVAIIPSIITEMILVYQLGIRFGSTGASLGLLVSEILFFIVLAKFTKINKYNFYNYLTIPLVVSLALILTNSFNVSVALFIIVIIGLMIRINKIRKGKMDV